MARATRRLTRVLRQTAVRLTDQQVTYRWSHFAHCNCGHLAQTITGLSPAEIQQRALLRAGDWAQQAERIVLGPDYGDRPSLDEGCFEPPLVERCSVSGAPLDEVFAAMFELGLTRDDIAHLERLSDPTIRRHMGTNREDFAHNQRMNVVAYLHAWADLLELELAAFEELPLVQAAE